MRQLSSRACNNLDEQGYRFLSPEEKNKLNVALRITPTLCIMVVIAGMLTRNWQVFAVLMTFGILGSATDRFQPFDVLYNMALRHVLNSPKLPPSPPQKRFACGMGALFLFGAAASFYLGSIIWGYVFGALYIIAAGLMALTHFCVASWGYNKLFSGEHSKH